MKLNLITVSLATLVAAGAFPAHAGPQAHVVCGYHHTLGDDAIMMFGKANQAMWHDFLATPTPMRSLPTRRCARNPIPPVIIKPTAPLTGRRP
ncbi:hypothetical protein GG963_06865 [Salmonella enterica]|nr:hypothetical protein [Salmonella enterica]EDJ6248845.1 hypothetical protein [Salmonella enterica subsp. enterica serovar Anatum]EDK8290353.1 hypothetical protein [Salmonella enterica]EDK8334395.1 hypothetical protein [Salmonella enterica subsp. enterica serovar Anatum]